MSAVHTYRCELRWDGSTAAGYENYSRSHRVRTPPAEWGTIGAALQIGEQEAQARYRSVDRL
jgi:hypothetical protein